MRSQGPRKLTIATGSVCANHSQGSRPVPGSTVNICVVQRGQGNVPDKEEVHRTRWTKDFTKLIKIKQRMGRGKGRQRGFEFKYGFKFYGKTVYYACRDEPLLFFWQSTIKLQTSNTL